MPLVLDCAACGGYPKSFIDPLLSTVPYSLRNNYIQPLPTPNLNLSSSLNIIPNPITPRFITPYSPSLTHLYQTLTHHWDLISKDTNLTQLFSTPQLCFRWEKAVSNHLVSAKILGRPPPPTADVPLQISTTAKRVKPCNHPLCLTCPKLLSYNIIHSSTIHINTSTSPIPSPVKVPVLSTASSVLNVLKCM